MYKMSVINFFRCQVATTLHPSSLKSSMYASTKLKFDVLSWARDNKKYLKIDIYLNDSSTLPINTSVTIM